VLVGIKPDIARTLVQIGVDFGALVTCGDLQAGVAYALERQATDEPDRLLE
jgi:rsbT co-antagonist protein RsbR